jgi:uncharacterized membrane protein (DUF373 family)
MSEPTLKRSTKSVRLADQTFQHVETMAYAVLGLLLAAAALLGIADAGVALFRAVQSFGNPELLEVAIDGSLFVLMIVEILHTVRASFRSGTLVCEPFLIVGLIALIRRVLVITLQSSQAGHSGKWPADSEAMLHSSMLELLVLAVLILVMVVSIYLLRKSNRQASDT